jgi:acetolactate synthase-1/2/3 large subunit
MQKSHFQGRLVAADSKSKLSLPNVIKIANAFGIATDRLEDNSLIRETIQRVLATDGPLVCEVIVDPDEPTIPRVVSVLTADGALKSKPMEDMSPLLDRDEFNDNMIVSPLDE